MSRTIENSTHEEPFVNSSSLLDFVDSNLAFGKELVETLAELSAERPLVVQL